jgi:triacylglycerol lipase
MATIAASRIQTKVIALITFGSPRAGNQEFVNSLKVTHYRVQNNCDDVTKVPFKLMGFAHHGTHKYMNFAGEFRDLTPWQQVKDMVRSRLKARAKGQKFIGIFDHMMPNYIAKLAKLGNN